VLYLYPRYLQYGGGFKISGQTRTVTLPALVGCDAAGLQANTYNGRGVSALSLRVFRAA